MRRRTKRNASPATAINANNRSADFNPSTQASLTFQLTQHLLQGFGWAVNSRQIHIARNQREISDLVFKQQVITPDPAGLCEKVLHREPQRLENRNLAIISPDWAFTQFRRDVRGYTVDAARLAAATVGIARRNDCAIQARDFWVLDE